MASVVRPVFCELKPEKQPVPVQRVRISDVSPTAAIDNVKIVLQPRLCTLRSYGSDRAEVMKTRSDGGGEVSPFFATLSDYIESSKKSQDFELISGRLAMERVRDFFKKVQKSVSLYICRRAPPGAEIAFKRFPSDQHFTCIPFASLRTLPFIFSLALSLSLLCKLMAIYNSLSLLPSSLSLPKLFNCSPLPLTATTTNLFSFTLFKSQTKPRMTFSVQFNNSSFSADPLAVGEDLPVDYADWYPKTDSNERRRAGVLLHPTSFPGPYGIGDLGDQAFRFLDWLHDAGCSVWQVLPLVPPGRKANEEGSPYSGQDANCGNTLLISLEELVKDGLLTKEELPKPVDADCVKFSTVADIKDPLIAKAAERLILSEGELKHQLDDFRKDPDIAGWLEDAAYFAAIDDTLNAFSWYDWPEPLKNRHLSALEEIYQTKKDFINIFIAQQFLFQRQWQKVRDYARTKGISIMGDMPIYVGYHSADVWANKKQFLLNRSGFPLLVSGVPPDAFSETGQLWDSPLYDWKSMEKHSFSWWICRVRRAQNLFDEFRIDHFRGFAGFWAVPSEAKIAMFGRWKVGPGKSLFDAIFRTVGKINIIAEDLGIITEDVVQLRKSIGAPGMAVLQFGFGSDPNNLHLPHNHEHNQVVYTGTHDNDTIRGWWGVLQQEEKSNVLKYLSIAEEDDIPWALIKAALGSVARTAIIPMQDILGLGNSARMNVPATQFGNWSWRIPSSMSLDSLDSQAKKLRDMILMYGRL